MLFWWQIEVDCDYWPAGDTAIMWALKDLESIGHDTQCDITAIAEVAMLVYLAVNLYSFLK